jgi:hypothetical protein
MTATAIVDRVLASGCVGEHPQCRATGRPRLCTTKGAIGRYFVAPDVVGNVPRRGRYRLHDGPERRPRGGGLADRRRLRHQSQAVPVIGGQDPIRPQADVSR